MLINQCAFLWLVIELFLCFQWVLFSSPSFPTFITASALPSFTFSRSWFLSASQLRVQLVIKLLTLHLSSLHCTASWIHLSLLLREDETRPNWERRHKNSVIVRPFKCVIVPCRVVALGSLPPPIFSVVCVHCRLPTVPANWIWFRVSSLSCALCSVQCARFRG